MTEDEPKLFKHPETDWLGQKFEATWICVACGTMFDYEGLLEDGHAHKDPPKFCPTCGAEAAYWEKPFPTLPEAARTVSMAVDVQLPETWADARRVPYERSPLTTHELEVMINTDTRLDLWHEAAQELLERRKADADALVKLAALGRNDVACQHAADLLTYHEHIGAKVLMPLVECLLAQLEQATGLATRLLELTAPPPIMTLARAVDIVNQEVARSKKEKE
jgi:hypothetical protein